MTWKGSEKQSPGGVAEGGDEVTLLVLGVEEEDGPVQGALLIKEHPGPGGLLGELVPSASPLLVLTVRATPRGPLWLAELDATLL